MPRLGYRKITDNSRVLFNLENQQKKQKTLPFYCMISAFHFLNNYINEYGF